MSVTFISYRLEEEKIIQFLKYFSKYLELTKKLPNEGSENHIEDTQTHIWKSIAKSINIQFQNGVKIIFMALVKFCITASTFGLI